MSFQIICTCKKGAVVQLYFSHQGTTVSENDWYLHRATTEKQIGKFKNKAHHIVEETKRKYHIRKFGHEHPKFFFEKGISWHVSKLFAHN